MSIEQNRQNVIKVYLNGQEASPVVRDTIAANDSRLVGSPYSQPDADLSAAAHSAAGRAPARLRLAPAPRARPRTPFRTGGRRFGPLALGFAALTALALLLPALLAGRAAAPVAQEPAAAYEAAAQAQPPAQQQTAAGGDASVLAPTEQAPEVQVRVYLTRTRTVETLPLEQYVTGVLAAEMPVDFELAALKAQAIAARTFIVARLQANDTSGVPGGKADVVDTVLHQAYIPQSALKEWNNEGRMNQLEKLQKAVLDTQGIIMTYKGKPITAAFFSASGGSTENSEDYWSLEVPYLRSVPSPWDARINPNMQETVTFSFQDMFRKLGQQQPATRVSTGKSGTIHILSTTAGGRVKEIRIGEQTYTGREIREKLQLRSSQFTIEIRDSLVNITTFGNGHGVGMSQWGANGMAKEGYTTTQILKHYYTGISFQLVR